MFYEEFATITTMNYVALLRGINVGGNSRVEMPRLKSVFESLGSRHVVTYINSGNVLFADDRDRGSLEPIIAEAIEKEFGFNVPVLLRTQNTIESLCKKIPSEWTNDSEQRTDVMFLWDAYDRPTIVQEVLHDPAFEHLQYIDGALVWNVQRSRVKAGAIIKLLKTDLYKNMTIRNINTVRKLNELLTQLPN